MRDGHASAVLAASIFHFGTYSVAEAKAHMAAAGLPVRLGPLAPGAGLDCADLLPLRPMSDNKRESKSEAPPADAETLARLYATIVARKGGDPGTSYTAKLLAGGRR